MFKSSFTITGFGDVFSVNEPTSTINNKILVKSENLHC